MIHSLLVLYVNWILGFGSSFRILNYTLLGISLLIIVVTGIREEYLLITRQIKKLNFHMSTEVSFDINYNFKNFLYHNLSIIVFEFGLLGVIVIAVISIYILIAIILLILSLIESMLKGMGIFLIILIILVLLKYLLYKISLRYKNE